MLTGAFGRFAAFCLRSTAGEAIVRKRRVVNLNGRDILKSV